ncbi:aspartate:alanine exchanger family transporter [Trueperella bialowiezensis]|uniref:Putative transporter n=1 Tax=Trueperella bialowiezensis TaxID=312285 RepID=A0A3S4V9S8_9ACTO|nr:TrkA C-terminal domain-containing protein [Trueperella bialowiezensis]VEI12763.1 putative transporter [Trueperella bialowiezensis]
MTAVFEFLASQPVLLAFFLVGLGMVFGHIKIKGISLGAAAVLFVAIGLSAWAAHLGVDLLVPHEIGVLGLALFAFTIGNNSGPSFFENVKKAVGPMVSLVALYGVVAGVGYAVGRFVFDMDVSLIAGTFAGSVTNTPALSAAGEASGDAATATVGYSIAYLYGVIGMLIAAYVALRKAHEDTDKPEPVTHVTLRVDRDDQPRLGEIVGLLKRPVEISRMRRGEDGPIWIPTRNDILEKDDLLTVVGTNAELSALEDLVGHRSSHSLRSDRRFLDFRRITVSEPKLAGKTIAELDEVLTEKFGATASRIRRGDNDMLAIPDFMIEMGDRIRVIGPTSNMKAISRFFGDSAKGLTDINPVALGLGIALGMAIGSIKIPLPGGSTMAIGAAAGALIVGLIFGRLGRIGGQVTALPNTTGTVLAEIGLLLFLAQAGTNAGAQILVAFSSGTWINILILGVLMTTTLAIGMFLVMRGLFKIGATQFSGMLAGAQTQPAVLAFANSRTNSDPRVALGYSLLYPVAMIGKIVVATILGAL